MSDADLIRSAVAKRNAGKKLSSPERKAIERAERAAFVASLRKLPATIFNDLFGVQNKTRYEWEEQLKIPCGRGRNSIDLFECGTVLRSLCSRRADMVKDGEDLGGKKSKKIDEEIRKLQEQIVRLKTENELQAGNRLPRSAVVEPLERMAAVIRSAGDRLARKSKITGKEAQVAINNAVAQFMRELETLKR